SRQDPPTMEKSASPPSTTDKQSTDTAPQHSVIVIEDVPAKREDTSPEVEATSPKVEDVSRKVEDASPRIEDASPKTEGVPAKADGAAAKAEDSEARLLAYLTSRARNFFYESINHVPGFDPSAGSDKRVDHQGSLPTQGHDELALYQRA